MAMSQRMWRREQERRRREREKRARQRRICMLVVLLMAAAAIFIICKGCFGKKPGSVTEAQPNTTETAAVSQLKDAEQYTGKYDITDVNTSYFDNTAFLGSSIADSISMYHLLENTDFYTSVTLDVDNVYTTATGYSTTAAVDQIKSKKFSKVFLCFGEREIVYDDVREFIKSYSSLVSDIKSYQPNARVYVIGIQPPTRATNDAGLYGMTLSKVKQYNKAIKKMAAEQKVYYVDTAAALGSDSGYLPAGVSADGISLNRGCCIDLLRYITKKSSVPKLSGEETEPDKDTDETDEDTDSGSDTDEDADREEDSDAEPEPTVNVLKDSSNRNKGD